jgi:hypothetical protein
MSENDLKKIKFTHRGQSEMKDLTNRYITDISKYLVFGIGFTYAVGFFIGDSIIKRTKMYFPHISKYRNGFCLILLSSFLWRGKTVCDKNMELGKRKILEIKENYEEMI